VVHGVSLVADVRRGERVAVRVVPGWCCRYICIRGDWPSGGVSMFALSMWAPSGRPWSVFAPSSVWVSTGSPCLPRPVKFTAWKLPAASVNPIGAAFRWSCQLFTKKNTCVAFCRRFARQENGLFGFQVHGYGLSQNDTPLRWNGLSL
jgi:hypothetical protein